MQPLHILFKAFDYVQSRNSPFCLALGAMEGMLLGLTPVPTLQWMVGFLLAISSSGHVGMGLITFSAFGLLFYPLTPFFDALGDQLLNRMPELERVWAWAYHAPLLPYCEFNNTVVLGSFTFCLFLFVPMFAAVYLLFVRFRTSMLRVWLSSPVYRKWNASRLNRLYARYQQAQSQS